MEPPESGRMSSIVKILVKDLISLEELIFKILHVVVTPSPTSQRKFPDPYLPVTVVEAFEQIVHLFILTSKQMSLINRFKLLSSTTRDRHHRAYDHKYTGFNEDKRQALHNARRLLEEGKMDILLSEFRSPIEIPSSLGFERVSSRFLVVALITSIQNRKIVPDEDRSITDWFRERIEKLGIEAIRRPQRRIFLDVQRLQEEMETVLKVLDVQAKTLELIRTEIYGRRKRPAEENYIQDHEKQLSDEKELIYSLQARAAYLKQLVVQSIEVLEEGHGKAIRVFTIVTLFFLPL
jgi:hypothetical protein